MSYSDGSCLNNPGPSGAGCAFFAVKQVQMEVGSDSEADDEVQIDMSEEKFLFGAQMHLDYCTNNYAEYLGLILSQVILSMARVPQVIFRADSQLLVNQVKGNSAVKNIRFVSMMPIVHDLIKHFKQVQIEYINRNENKVADALAKDAASRNVGFS
jgi:ribonuclease HI